MFGEIAKLILYIKEAQIAYFQTLNFIWYFILFIIVLQLFVFICLYFHAVFFLMILFRKKS